MTLPRKPNPAFELYSWFVTQYLKREIGPGDNKGQHLANAKAMLQEFDIADIKGCLIAARDGWLGADVPVERLTSLPSIKWFEPPLIARWMKLKDTPPPIYETERVRQWQELTGRVVVKTTKIEVMEPVMGGVYAIPE